MTDAPALRAFFGDREHVFRLTVPLVAELERQTGQGIGGFSRRLMGQDFRLADLHNTIRLGLIGGGETSPEEAAALVANYGASVPVLHQFALAVSVIEILMMGPAEEIPTVVNLEAAE
ncbi:MAG: gene transfer agent family protein [Cereibacter sphaeroides]|uniref:Gene transfer agent family protein n=1 Tax=Cereibacter sphaeroides TaxID=1063 RepID=A0A2W5S9C5_CERSP|nr:MAG: gene transfer agent family protein [Cereibacter sphaeroides]